MLMIIVNIGVGLKDLTAKFDPQAAAIYSLKYSI